MDATEEHVTLKEALKKIAELEYSQNKLRDLNMKMKQWLDVADEEVSALRSENTNLQKHVTDLEKSISAARQSEAELCGSCMGTELSVEICSDKTIRRLEEESTKMKDQNKKLTAELKSLQQEREQDKINLRKFKVAIQSLEKGMEEAQLELQERDEVIHENNLKLSYLEETVEEFSNFIKELKLMNQELSKKLEDRQDEATFIAINDRIGEKKELPCCHLSFAEEMGLLASTAAVETNISDFKYLKQEETEGEEQLKQQSPTVNLQTQSLEKSISATQQSEAELCGSCMGTELSVEICSDKTIRRLEDESTMMKEQNKKLTAELKSLQQEREQDLRKFKVAIQSLEKGMEEAQLELQERDEVIHEKNMKLSYLEETVEEFSNFIKLQELKLMNQELSKKLEDRQDEATLIGEKKELPCCHLSFAEEMGLLASTAAVETNISDFKDLKQEETEGEEQLKQQSPTVNLQTKSWSRILETVIQAGLFLLCIFIFTLLAFLALGSCTRNYELFSINTLWKVVRLILLPYCSVHYGALPPI